MQPSRLEILNKIGEYFQDVIQWNKLNNFKHCEYYTIKAECLIELLEIKDCGYTGGFDLGQSFSTNLFDRWDWLFKKYNCSEQFDSKDGPSYIDIFKFYKRSNDE